MKPFFPPDTRFHRQYPASHSYSHPQLPVCVGSSPSRQDCDVGEGFYPKRFDSNLSWLGDQQLMIRIFDLPLFLGRCDSVWRWCSGQHYCVKAIWFWTIVWSGVWKVSLCMHGFPHGTVTVHTKNKKLKMRKSSVISVYHGFKLLRHQPIKYIL